MSEAKGETDLVLVEQIEPRILVLRGQRVILDADLAGLYGVTTRRLNEQAKRNAERFPPDFMFQLTAEEAESMRSQTVTTSATAPTMRSQFATASKRNLRYRPHAFTEHGAIMAASVLNSQRAIDVSVYVVRAFVRLRQVLATHAELSRRLDELERKVGAHDEAIQTLVSAIRQLMGPPPRPKRRPIGFHVSPADP